MKHTKYAFIVGAILLAGAISVAALTQLTTAQSSSASSTWTTNSGENGTGKQFLESLANKTGLESLANKTGGTGNYTVGSNFMVGNGGFANGTTISGIGSPVDTATLKMQISQAKSAMQSNNTQGAMMHIIAALDKVEMILSGNTTTTANATGTTTGNMTSMPNATSAMNNSTGTITNNSGM